MADNVAITAGAGTTIGTDDVGGVQIQRVKTTWGPDGTANDTDVATGKPLPVQLRSPTGTTLLGSAGTSATDVLTVQGIASGTAMPVSVASVPSHAVTNAGTFAVQAAITSGTLTTVSTVTNLGTINSVAPSFGSGSAGSTTQRTVLATDSPGIITVGTAGTASTQVVTVQGIASATPVIVSNTPLTNFGAGEYETVAASQTAQALGATGSAGDFISGILVVPATTSAGNVLLLDNATSITVFTGGNGSLSNLVPFLIPLGMISVSGAWKITTGANVSCIGIGNFT